MVFNLYSSKSEIKILIMEYLVKSFNLKGIFLVQNFLYLIIKDLEIVVFINLYLIIKVLEKVTFVSFDLIVSLNLKI